MIELESVTKRYGDKTAVADLNLTIPSGSLCVLIGPSGCGKTTTLRMINRLVSPTSGRICIDGAPVANRDVNELRRNIGYVIQHVGLFPHMTVAQNVATVPILLKWDREVIRTRVDELLDLVGLEAGEYGPKYPRQLSGGEAQRIGVARALAADPDILLMDEPFGAVDPLNRGTLQSEFLKIQRQLKKTVVFVTHDIDEAIRMADLVVLMKGGQLVQVDDPETLLAHPKNDFVRNFVGADRALKRLSRFTVERIMLEPFRTRPDTPREDLAHLGRYYWVEDNEGFFVGWVNSADLEPGERVEDAMAQVAAREFCLHPDDTLKDALSRMIHEGVQSLPVADDRGHLVGAVTLRAIQDFASPEEEE